MHAPRALSLALLLLASAGLAHACCTAFPAEARVAIADQEVLIAYDAERGIEHFVRRATFEAGPQKGFGFLVPTPTQPEVAEADADVFGRLQEAIKPRVEHRTRYRIIPSMLLAPLSAGARAAPAALEESAKGRSVNVLDQVRVAGYDAAVLEASDAEALSEWLSKNGYTARPELKEWLEPYLAAKWKVTAFKYAAEPGEVTAKAVRLSFPTERPLFPFRVPRDLRSKASTLRVFYVGPGRAQATFAEGDGSAWQAKTKWAGALSANLSGALPAGVGMSGAWLTTFEDPTWPSGGDDLYFSEAEDQTPVEPPPVIRWQTKTIVLPGELLILLLPLGYWLYRRKRAKAQA